jgi:uncharacterized protein YndB with AHSA1/START domain
MPALLPGAIRFSQDLAHPVGDVWRAVADRALLSRWFMPTHDFELWVGHAFTFREPPQRGWDGITHCEILEVEPGRTLAFSYRGKATGQKAPAGAGAASRSARDAARGLFAELDTVLRFTLEPLGPGRSRLHLEHTGFRGARLMLVRLIMGWGWKKILRERLPKALAEAAATVARV